ncbi:MAG: GldG family protein [Oscillospiraceae bacterium]|nr:GldG family protein [Oscillospiraceae bacterium]
MKGHKSFFRRLGASLTTRAVRVGGYSTLALVIVLAIATMANVLAGSLPSSWTQLDTTASQIFSLSGQTEHIVSSLDEDVTVYWIVQQGREDSTVETLLSRYESLSDRLKVVRKDPDVYPTFAREYTEADIYNNSLIVVSGERSSYIGNNELYEYDYSSYYSTGTYQVSYVGESALTSAIRYVTDENIPVLYLLTGHGEAELSSSFENAVKKENISMASLSLLTVDEVPGDADCILINAPQNDISAEEEAMLLSYLQDGGRLILVTDPPKDGVTYANLNALMAEYGMTGTAGIVLETKRDIYAFGAPYYLLPELQAHSITSPLRESGYYVLMPIAHGIKTDNSLRDSLTVTSLLTATDSSFSKLDGYAMENYERDEDDPEGPFTLAALAEEGDAEVIWISSASLLQDEANMQVAGGNLDFFLNCLNYICQQEESISIHAKNISNDYLTMSSSTAAGLSVLVVFVIPATALAAGIIVWIRRKRR